MNDPIAKPAINEVTHFGFTVPVFEHMLVGEIDDLQRIMSDQSTTGFRKDIESFVVLVRHRTKSTPKIEKMLREPVDQVAFARDLRALLAPFTRAQKALFYENKTAAAEMLTGEQLDAEINLLEAVLTQMRSMRSESNEGERLLS